MNVLIDTSVWVDYFKHGNKNLIELMSLDFAMTHPMVLLEFNEKPKEIPITENEKLYGLGCGLVDMSLLASTLLTPDTQIWTLDKRLLQLATRFRVAYVSYVH